MKSNKERSKFIESNRPFQRNSFINSDDRYFDFIFLCGRSIEDKISNRNLIRKCIFDKDHKFVIYAESFYKYFNNLERFDLSLIENILLDISSAVVIILESPGSICELGAFSFLKMNTEKTWAINDIKYLSEPSFIRDGPLRRLNKDHVIYCEFDNEQIKNVASLKQNLSKVGRISFHKNSITKNKAESKIGNILDLNFLTCLVFDYINLFGVLDESEVDTFLHTIFPEYDSFQMILSSDDTFSKQDDINFILKGILYVLVESDIVIKKSLSSNHFYYTPNYELMKNIGIKRNEISFIYKSSFLRSKNTRKTLARIRNSLKQDGYILWND